MAPLFTDLTYDNLGVPGHPENPFYTELDFNPLGARWVDLGLGGFLETRREYADLAEDASDSAGGPSAALPADQPRDRRR